MGTFAETEKVDYRLSFADQGKQTFVSVSVCTKRTEVCCFRFPFAINKRILPFSVSSVLLSRVCLCGCVCSVVGVCVYLYLFIFIFLFMYIIFIIILISYAAVLNEER
jgi:hypothetical protein